jgi:hypothetical protein
MTSTAKPVSAEVIENTRRVGARIESEILRCLADTTQEHAALCMGVSGSTVSRMRERVGEVAQLLAALDLQVAAADSVVVDRDDQRALKRMAFNYLKADLANEAVGMMGPRE